MGRPASTVFGAEVIHHGPPSKSHLSSLSLARPSMDSLSSTIVPPIGEQPPMPKVYDPTSNPCSAFYSHPTTRTSFEQQKSESKVHLQLYQHDLESGSRIAHSHDSPGTEKNPVWPCQSTLLKQESDMRRSRSCGPFRALSPGQRLLVQVGIALLVIGTVFGLGFGVAKATGTGIYKNTNSQTSIAGTDRDTP